MWKDGKALEGWGSMYEVRSRFARIKQKDEEKFGSVWKNEAHHLGYGYQFSINKGLLTNGGGEIDQCLDKLFNLVCLDFIQESGRYWHGAIVYPFEDQRA